MNGGCLPSVVVGVMFTVLTKCNSTKRRDDEVLEAILMSLFRADCFNLESQTYIVS